jgi:Fic family protein
LSSEGDLYRILFYVWRCVPLTIHVYLNGGGYHGARQIFVYQRKYRLSSQILKDRENDSQVLEEVQKGSGDLSGWQLWFFKTFLRSLKSSIEMIEEILVRQTFKKHITDIEMNARQRKVVNKMIEKLPNDFIGGMTNKKYVKITNTSPATAKRDLQDLVDKKVLIPSGAGRSVSYQINKK